jgi:hypothetical protein
MVSSSEKMWLLFALNTDLKFSVGLDIDILWEWAVVMAFQKANDGLLGQVNSDAACGKRNGESRI